MRAGFIVLAILNLGGALAQEVRPKIAIKTFQNPPNAAQSNIGNGLTDILTTELQNTGKFNILERSAVDELLKEMNFAESDAANKQDFVKKGQLLGAQYLLVGKVTNFSFAEHKELKKIWQPLGPEKIQTIFQQEADVRVDFRVIDISSGETIVAQAGQAHKTNTSQISEIATWRRVLASGSIASESSSSLIGKATVEAIKDIVRKLNALSEEFTKRETQNGGERKGKVVAEVGGGLWIIDGFGTATGLKKGDRLILIRENAVKDEKDQVVYRKEVPIGHMEVTDVNQPDHAEVRFIAIAGGSAPQVHDVVKSEPGPGRNVVHDGNPEPGPDPTALLKKADSYLGDRMWSQALDQYKAAAKMSPNDPRALQGIALSHYMIGDFVEADDAAEKLLASGGSLSFPIAHFHAMGLCTGVLTIQKGKLAYSGTSDAFEIGPNAGVAVEIHKPKGMIANEKLPDWPILDIRGRAADGKEKKAQMLPYNFCKQQNRSGKNIGSAFPMDDSDVAQMEKFERSMAALIQKFVR